MYKCINCSWEGESPKQDRFCLICGDNVIKIKEEIKVEVQPIIKEEIVIPKPSKNKPRRKNKGLTR